MDHHLEKFKKPLKVLVIEDNLVDRRVIEAMLMESDETRPSFLKIGDSLKEAVLELEKNTFDVLILDLNLPDSTGKNSLKTLTAKYPTLPIVINTGAYEEELGLETLSYGAQDFLVKGKYSAYVLYKVMRYAIERKHLENELRIAYQQLKETQDQLLQVEKMEVVGRLASGVAHEVKNPLATIQYGITYLNENVHLDDKNYNLVLTNITQAVDRASRIINDLLDFSSMRNFNKEKANLNSLIERTLNLVYYELEKSKIKVEKCLDQQLPLVLMDLNRIEQVIVNLILNACNAIKEKNGKVKITTFHSQVTPETKKKFKLNDFFQNKESIAVLQIDDEGIGIPEMNLNKIFDPFFTSRRAQGGVGLGLSISRSIIENHGGQITVENLVKGVRAQVVLKT